MKKGNKVLSYILTLVLLTTALNIAPITVNAEESGGWRHSDGVITGYTGPGGNVVIPDTLDGYPVTGIGYIAFDCSHSITSVTIPDSVTYIGDYAFTGCANLRTVIIGKNVRSIGAHAFRACRKLTIAFKSPYPPSFGDYALQTNGYVEYYNHDGGYFKGSFGAGSAGLTIIVPIGAKSAYLSRFRATRQYTATYPVLYDNRPANSYYWDDLNMYWNVLVGSMIFERDTSDDTKPNEVLVKSGDAPVSGATVTLTYSSARSGITDTEGKTVFNDIDYTGTAVLRVTKDGYHDYEESISLPMQHRVIVNLTEETKPYLKVANYNGKSLLRETANLNRQATSDHGIAQFEFDCEIESGVSDYRLVYKSGGAEVKADGRFTLFKDQFVENMPVFLTVVANNGKSHTEQLNIQVNDFTFPEGLTQEIGGAFSLKIPNDAPVFPGTTLSIPKDNFVMPILAEVTDDKVKLGFNVDPAGKNLKQLDEIVKSDLNELAKNTLMLAPIIGYAYYVVDIAGYAELDYIGNNNFAVSNSKAYAQAMINAAGKVSALNVVEAQLEWLGHGMATGTLERVNFEDYTVYFAKTDLDLKSELTGKLGAGVPVVASAGVYGKSVSDTKMQMFPEFELKEWTIGGEMGVYGQFVVFEGRIPILNPKIPYYIYPTGNNFIVASEDINAFLYNADNYSVIDSASYSAFNSPPDFTAAQTAASINTLQANAYTYIKPQIVTCGNTTLMAYIDKKAGRDEYNFPALVYRLYENGSWNAAQEVNAAEFADSEFSLYTDGTDIYIANTQANRLLTASDDVSTVLEAIDVYAAKFDKGTKKFVDPVRLTNDSVFNKTPVMTSVGGNPAVLWLSNSENDLFGTAGENCVILSVKDGGTWQTATLATEPSAIVSLQAGILDGKSTAAYIVDGDNDFDTSDDKTLYTISLEPGAAKVQAGDTGTIENAVFSNDNLYVYRNSGLIKTNGSTASAINGELLNSDFDFITLPDNRTLLVYKAQFENGVGLYASILDGDTLSEPVVLTETENYIDGYALAVIDGKLTAVFIETIPTFTDDGFTTYSDFNLTGVDITKTKLGIGEISFEISKTGISSDFDIIFEARNIGMTDISGFKAEIFEKDSSTLTSVDFDDILSAGTTNEFAMTVSSLYLQAGRSYMLKLSANDSNIEKDIVFDINDCMIDAKSMVIGDENIISVSVVNMGLFPSKGTLYGYNGDATGEVIFERLTKLFELGEFVNYQIKVDDLDCTKGYVSFIFVPDEGDENPLGNTSVVRLFDTPEWISLPDTLNVTVTGTDKTILFEDYPKEGGLALIVALYKGDRLTGTEIPDITSDGNITTTIDLGDADTIKLMLWNSVDIMMPLCKSKTIEWIDDAWESD